VYNLGSSREVSINELARLVISLTGSRSEIAHIPYEQAYGRGFEDLQRRIPNLHRVHALIGWTVSIPLEDTLRSVIEYLRIQNA
jgi:UDP-glucose 4-epimerase